MPRGTPRTVGNEIHLRLAAPVQAKFPEFASELTEQVLDAVRKGELTLMLTVEEAGEMLKVSRSTAYRMAAKGTIPTTALMGGIRRVPIGLFLEMYKQWERSARRAG